jgi:hypothetical protein
MSYFSILILRTNSLVILGYGFMRFIALLFSFCLLTSLVSSKSTAEPQTLIFDISYEHHKEINNIIDRKHGELEDSLGVPVGEMTVNSDRRGVYRKYDNGYIYWSPETGAHVIFDGPILTKWQKQGSETGELGYPTTDEMNTLEGRGRLCSFQGGLIFWNRKLGVMKIIVLTSRPVLFLRKNFRGSSLALRKSIGRLNGDKYERNWTGISLNESLKEVGFDDGASSLFVPEGWSVIFYENEGYCGRNFKIAGPAAISDLKSYNGGEFDNEVTSAKVISEIADNSSKYGELVLDWAGVIDNKEGEDGIHGPYGNFHILIYDASEPCYGERSSYPVPLRHIVLPGPNNTGNMCEWEDGDQMDYDRLGLFQWRGEEDSVKVFIYESDPSRELPKLISRKHDPVFCQVIDRKEGEPGLFPSNVPAMRHTVVSGKNRSRLWIDKVRSIWDKGLESDMPSMFVELETVYDGAHTYNDREL